MPCDDPASTFNPMARLPMVNSLLEFRPGGFSLRVNHVQLTPQTHDSHRFIRGHAPLSSFHAAFRYPPMNHAQLGRTLFFVVRQRSWDLDTFAVFLTRGSRRFSSGQWFTPALFRRSSPHAVI